MCVWYYDSISVSEVIWQLGYATKLCRTKAQVGKLAFSDPTLPKDASDNQLDPYSPPLGSCNTAPCHPPPSANRTWYNLTPTHHHHSTNCISHFLNWTWRNLNPTPSNNTSLSSKTELWHSFLTLTLFPFQNPHPKPFFTFFLPLEPRTYTLSVLKEKK